MNGPSNTPASYRNRLLFLIGAIAGLVIGAYVYNAGHPVIPPGPVGSLGESLSPEMAGQMVHDMHVAIAALENDELQAADKLFLEIGQRLPQETMPIRNLTIGRFLAYDLGKGDLAAVEEALGRLHQAEPAAATTAWLDAITALKASNNLMGRDPDASDALLARVIKSLQAAESRAPAMIAYPYQMFEVLKISDNADARKLGEAALGRAYQKAPDNLFVLGEWLLVQAENEDASIVETLKSSIDTIAPLRKQIQDTMKVDVLALVDEAIEAADQGNWPLVKRHIRVVFFMSRWHDFAQGDLKRLKPHPLEFVEHDFSSAFYETYPQPTKPSPRIEVSFVPLATDRQLPTIEDAVDMLAVDFDLNGAMDIVVLRPTSVEVYGQAEPASAWQLLTTQEIPPGMRGLLVADLDHDRDHAIAHEEPVDGSPGPIKPHVCYDADVDIVIFGDPGLLVLRNELDPESQQRSLVPVEQSTELDIAAAHCGVLVDFDHDSNLDIILAGERGIVALLALGNMTFADATSYSHMPSADHPFTSLLPVDWDRDADIDIVATSPAGGLIGYLENRRHGNFSWVVFDNEFDALKGSTSLSLLDCDGNASWDLVGTGDTGFQLVQTQASPSGAPRAMRASKKTGNVKFNGLTLWDYDNDGFQDALAWSDDSLLVYRGSVDGSFTIAESMFGEARGAIQKCDVADFDADGDQDVAVLTPQGITIYSNEGGNANHWLEVRTLGRVDNKGKSNHNGIGGLIEIKTGSRYQAQVVHRPVTHFGLGELERADVIRYLWPNGVPQATVAPVTNQAICEIMVLKGSCPYLYTWTGEKFEFFTDLLWAAPIGLQFAEGVLAEAREWEYLMIPGSRLKPRDGLYTLQVTEELWEAAYFESIRLIAIDHPADIEVFSNEKVGPAEIAEHQLHTVRNRRAPVAARDKHARNVLPQILQRDGTFMRGFDKNVVPGLVDEHYLELDLGNLKDAQQIKLFLTGWVYPTDTSLNIALSRHPDFSGPKPPAIWVPDENGTWQETIPYMGFPGGKTKTIVVDVSKAFLTDDFRLRIVTTGEFYWDEVFFTVDELPAELRQTPLTLRSADLHYRGFSQPLPPQENSPEIYDYQKVNPARRWPTMDGRFTKFGNVRELLIENDDRLVVIGAGDEITLTFDEPAVELPEGWVRDFVIHNVGWDKDADLNTVNGQTVEPLPFVGMRHYPFPVDQTMPDSPEYFEYLRKYQTRKQKHSEFWNTIRDY